MKKLLSLIFGLIISTSSPATEPFKEIDRAVEFIRSFTGEADELKLPISNSLNDPLGMNMAIILDVILEKGFIPDGFEQHQDYKIYRYKSP